MGTLLTLLTLGAGLGGLGWWISTRDDEPEQGAGGPPPSRALPPPPDLPPPALPPPLPSSPTRPRSPAIDRPRRAPDRTGTRYLPPPPPSIAPSDFVPRMRSWLEQGPPATQIELVAVHLERAGHEETATQLRGLARDRRTAERSSAERTDLTEEDAPSDPPAPTSRSRAPAGSSESSPASASDSSPSTADGSDEPSAPSAPSAGAPSVDGQVLAQLARRVAAMLHARQGQGTDRRLVRQFQVAAHLFPSHGESPSGLYGPVTRAALTRHGVRNPPRPRFRAALEAAAPRPRPSAPSSAARRGTPRPRTAAPRSPARAARPNPNRTSSAR